MTCRTYRTVENYKNNAKNAMKPIRYKYSLIVINIKAKKIPKFPISIILTSEKKTNKI